MIQHPDPQITRQFGFDLRLVGSAQRIAKLRHGGFVGGNRLFSGRVLRVDDARGRICFIGCTEVLDETGAKAALQGNAVVVVPGRTAADWDAGLLAAARAADALAEQAATAAESSLAAEAQL